MGGRRGSVSGRRVKSSAQKCPSLPEIEHTWDRKVKEENPMGLLERLRGGSGLTFPLPSEWWQEGPVNDATAYGVLVKPAAVSPGQAYWRVVRVHHLTPEENRGRHHIFVEVLDEAGHRVTDARVRFLSEAGERVVGVQPDPRRPAVAFPMDRWQVYDVEMEGLPSDRVIGLTAAHPEEAAGNPQFRHSFLLVWQRSVAPEARIPEPEVEGEATPAAEEAAVEAPASAPAAVPPPPEHEPAPAPEEAPAPAEGPPVPVAEAPSATDTMDAATAEVAAREVETPADARPQAEPSTERATGAEVAVAEETTPVFDTYVLFAGAQDPTTLAAFFVLLDDILAAGLPFGFDTLDAALQAERILVVGRPDADTQRRLAESGREVTYLEGTGADLKARMTDVLSAG